MADYGSIPPASSPPSLDFISRAKQRGQSALSTRRPWREMIQPHAFSLPLSLGDAYLRIRTNAAYFSMNYAISVVFVVFLSLLFHPVSLLVYVAVIAAWMFLFFLRDQSLVIGGRTFEESYILIGLTVFTIALLLITNSTLDIIGSVATGIVVVLVHAVLRRTDDLPVDEEAAAAGGWYAVAGESSSKTSPVS
ncbi:PRA1 family protein F2-like [Phalaenopsis equestris]|uniref:PRA1 family protein F2-like n=1 Tax=Phalaenopsis equestris TaxID=78828 RepID=UPI0009E3C2B6|nr:PRA1 family protein F2-like [Phalaenopsis equestris]